MLYSLPMKALKRIAPFAVIAVAALLLLYSPDIAPERYNDLATFFRVEMKRQGYSGFSVAAVVDGSVLYVDGFGKDGAGVVIGPDTRLYAPAAAKSMAALSAYALVRERRIALDSPVRDYLPWFELAGGKGGDVTVRNLLSHTSGLSDTAFDDVHPAAADLESAARSLVGALPSTAAGKRFQYIDTDYQALALIMEKATGKDYASILDDRVFKPLDMRSSSGRPPAAPPLGSASFFALPLSRPATMSVFGASSNYVVTTASDMGQYMAFLLGPEKFKRGPISVRAVPSLFEPLIPGFPYGYGLFLGQEQGARVAYHDGSLDGFSSRLVLWPSKRAGVAVLAAQSSLLQSLFALPSLTDGARRIMQEGSSPRPFPLGRLYILLGVVAIVSIFALIVQTGGALHWTKEVRDKAEAKGTRGPIRLAIIRCWSGIAVRAALAALCPIAVGLAFGRAVSWNILVQLEPGLAAWFLIACAFGVLRNAARLAWMRGPAGFHRAR
jgi:CubicO group peptidase (beta-lactamase class C family)